MPTLTNVRDRWRVVQALIIDEVSMIDGILFDKLEHIARILRNSSAPFGGIQVNRQISYTSPNTEDRLVDFLPSMQRRGVSALGRLSR